VDFKITFPGQQRVNAEIGPFTIETDQDGSAPAPFTLFLASLGTCAGIYVLRFCQQRGLSTQGLEIIQRMSTDPVSHMVQAIDLEIKLPEGFPDKYRDAVIRVAEQCAVKKHLQQPPAFTISAR